MEAAGEENTSELEVVPSSFNSPPLFTVMPPGIVADEALKSSKPLTEIVPEFETVRLLATVNEQVAAMDEDPENVRVLVPAGCKVIMAGPPETCKVIEATV